MKFCQLTKLAFLWRVVPSYLGSQENLSMEPWKLSINKKDDEVYANSKYEVIFYKRLSFFEVFGLLSSGLDKTFWVNHVFTPLGDYERCKILSVFLDLSIESSLSRTDRGVSRNCRFRTITNFEAAKLVILL